MNSPVTGRDADAGGGIFATTHWSVVLAAQGRSPAADAALETLCRAYWLPLYAFSRREGYEMEEAKDLTQEFFARWLERRDFDAARREKGRLRSYLLVSLKHFLTNERNKARTADTATTSRRTIPFVNSSGSRGNTTVNGERLSKPCGAALSRARAGRREVGA